MEFEIKEGELFLLIEKEIYNEDVLHKCFYWYGNNFNIEISSFSEKLFSVRLQPLNKLENLQNTIIKVNRDLIDFKLRDIVTKETKTIRELIIAKAFAYYESEDDNPLTEISDPVGFNPANIRKYSDK